jgi:ABC-type transport system involved in cytochrome bd biosynthesis fused ATPase/permease subunit
MPTSSRNASVAAVSTTGLRKSYGDKTVLDGIDLHIPAGSVFALLGPNGAGKTTVVKILSTLITADGGQSWVGGHDLTAGAQAVRASIGVTGQFSAVDGLITGEEIVHRRALAGDADHGAHRIWLLGEIVTGDAHLATIGGDQRGENLHRGGLARAIRAEQCEGRSLDNVQINAVEHNLLSI